MSEAEISNLEERERYNIVLNNRDESSSSVQSICEKEECDQIDECLRKMADFAQSQANLLPANSSIIATLGHLGSWARLLVDKPPDSKDDPVYMC